MGQSDMFNADQRAFWGGPGGRIWVARQDHTDTTLTDASAALLARAAPRPGERVLDVGCGCGSSTLEMARAVGSTGRVTAMDISETMLAEGRVRADAAGIGNISWTLADAAVAPLDEYDLLVSNCGVMFFGDPVAAFSHLRGAARPGGRMTFICWRALAENPWLQIPMGAVSPHIPPRPAPNPEAPGMFAFADPDRVHRILTAAGWTPPQMEELDLDLDIAAGRGLEEAVVQSTQIGAVNSWLRNQPADIVNAAVNDIRAVLAPHAVGESVRLPGAMWLVSSQAT